jgi:hypothetical protein
VRIIAEATVAGFLARHWMIVKGQPGPGAGRRAATGGRLLVGAAAEQVKR